MKAFSCVESVPTDVFFGDIQKRFLTSYEFSKLRCGGEKDLSDKEKKFIEDQIKKYFPDYDIKENGLMPIACALTKREMNKI